MILTQPPAKAAVGQEVRYQAAAISSIGHLTCKGGYNAAFWDREKLTWSLETAPEWLRVDPQSGMVSGVPKTPGTSKATLLVKNNKGGCARQGLVIEAVAKKQ